MAQPKAFGLQNWKLAWNNPAQRKQMALGSVLLVIILSLMPLFFNAIEKRNGAVLNDFLLAAIPPRNVSLAIFSVIWGMGLFFLVRVIGSPSMFTTFIWCVFFMSILRIISISVAVLNPPAGAIILSDPLTDFFYGEKVIMKDLFFSGHTAILVLITLCLEKKTDKIIGCIAVLVLAVLLLLQHVHYTIDVIAAPLIMYPLYRLVKTALKPGKSAGRSAPPDNI